MQKQQKLLSKVNYPKDIKCMSIEELNSLAQEIREMIIQTVSKTGGHLGANLGVVEMTIALHKVFNMPYDKIIWDVGHQCYTHKILTGRKDKMNTLRQPGGISGFPKIKESEYDSFGTGHSSTSISAALGMAVARDLSGEKDRNVIAVIGDGAMSGGMAYEAMNNAGDLKSRLIVVLNDNDMSISKPVGAMSKYLSKLIASRPYLKLRKTSKNVLKNFPSFFTKIAKRFEKSAKDVITGGNIFEDLGFYYVGPIDGHNIEEMIQIFENIKTEILDKPTLIHCRTEKGRGFEHAVKANNKLHSIGKFDIETGEEINKKGEQTFSDVFGETLCELARKDDKIIAITAAMTEGTGLTQFAKEFPDRFFDVGIAEQHAVTFAAGLATQGYKPFVAIYSTFLQRAFDQVIHDVSLQNLPVRFAIDRAGEALEDGETHHGIYDKLLLSNLPNFEILEPKNKKSLKEAIDKAWKKNNGPIAFRFKKGVAK